MTGDNFVLDTQHFIKRTRVSRDKPVLILLDNHQSRLDIKVLDLYRGKWSGNVISTSYFSPSATLRQPSLWTY